MNHLVLLADLLLAAPVEVRVHRLVVILQLEVLLKVIVDPSPFSNPSESPSGKEILQCLPVETQVVPLE